MRARIVRAIKAGLASRTVGEDIEAIRPARCRCQAHSTGVRDEETWGKRADWVDYHGPLDGETVGIAIFDHPSSFRHPTGWHVRTYGLFAANPFGVSTFDKSLPKSPTTVDAGQKLRFRYRVIIHPGDTATADIANRWKQYTAGK